MKNFAVLTMRLLCLAVLAGCQQSTALPEGDATRQETAPSQAETKPSEAVTVRVASLEEIDAAIAAHKGKVVVVDCWGTSCTPCLRDFHHLVELHKKHAATGLVCMSLCFDYEGGDPQETLPPVQEFLDSQGAVFENLMASASSTKLYKHLKIGAIPTILVYNREGVRKEFTPSGDASDVYTDVTPYVEGMLGGKDK